MEGEGLYGHYEVFYVYGTFGGVGEELHHMTEYFFHPLREISSDYDKICRVVD